MKNKLADLHNHLFAQLERLSDEELKGEKLKEEIQRSRAVAIIGKNIIANGNLVLSAQKAWDERELIGAPELLGIKKQ